jgi:hypothetical protein
MGNHRNGVGDQNVLHLARLLNLKPQLYALALVAHEAAQHEHGDDGQHEQVGKHPDRECEPEDAQDNRHVENR